jgi:hypothetical protein
MKRCACCGACVYGRIRQWHNQDTGYSLCAECAGSARRRQDYDGADFERTYGREGVHYPRVVPACENCGLSRKDVKMAARVTGTPVCCQMTSEALLKERLFCGIFPTGWSWADRAIEEHGDYQTVAYMSFEKLELEIRKPGSPLVPMIQKHAEELQAKRGQQYQVSTCGQTVMLGGMKK